jgi:hypothetical protein
MLSKEILSQRTADYQNWVEAFARKRDEIAEKSDVAGLRRCGFLPIDPPLDIDAPFLRILSAEKSLVDIFPLSSDLDSPRA